MSEAVECLVVDRVHVWRGDRHVLKGTSLSVGAGELLHIWGPNGTGKTTLLRVVSGLLRPEAGSVAWRGHSIASIREQYQGAMVYASHEPALKADLTAMENLHFSVGLRRCVTENELRAALERTGVGACADLPARVLSAGQRRRVAMARILAARVPLWLLDEPYTNLDGAGGQLLNGLLDEHVAAGGCALVVAHHDLAMIRPVSRMELAA